MTHRINHLLWILLCSTLLLATGEQVPAQSRITSAIKPEVTVEVPYSKSLLIARSVDNGRIPAGQHVGRMVLMLTPSAEQSKAAEAFVAALHDPSSPSFHKWVTPAQFGEQFGVASEDAETVRQWLESSGFTVHEVAQSRRFVVFSGTAGQVESAFGTEMHSYTYNGNKFIGNATNVKLPAALQPVVKGVVRLYGDPRTPLLLKGQKINVNKKTGQIEGPYGLHFLAPADFATIYNLKPLYAAGIDGTGQTIAIVSRSSLVGASFGINGMQDVRDFRTVTNLPANDPQVIVNGDDPMVLSYGDTAEAMLDTTWAGAVAPRAHIIVVASQSNFADGVDASAAYIVDHNLAPIMSTSFGTCENDLGSVENSFYAALWQQAAAQGITSFVSAGDNGGAGCDSQSSGQFASGGLAVNGISSTPYNVSVGGTQFDDVANPDAYWANTSDPVTLQSALGYIPEKVWNESSNDPFGTSLWAGGGGVSTIYAKPDWQSANGVPNDGHRDMPDISLAAAGHTGYAVCWRGSCANPPQIGFYTFGGTSASSPSAAGIMALVLQSLGGQPQGMANYVIYRLAGTPGVYHDITVGDNKVPGPDGRFTVGYSAGPGYDLASGLGSLDANAFVTHWKNASAGSSSATTLALKSSGSVVHGNPIAFQTNVACAGNACAAPTGEVSLLASGSNGNFGVGVGGLAPGTPSTALISAAAVPGGTYAVSARYSGDGKYYASSSNSVNVSVTPESSQMAMGSIYSGFYTTTPATVSYATPLPIFIAVAGNSGQGYPSGTVSLLTDGQPASVLAGDYKAVSPLTLNYGERSFTFTNGTTPLAQSSTMPKINWGLPVGPHQLAASYPGDNSFGPASTTFSFTVTKADSFIADFFPSGTAVAGVPVDLMGQLALTNQGCAPYGGTVTITDYAVNPPAVLGSAPASQLYCDSYTVPVTFTTGGTHNIRVTFSGDSNVNGSYSKYQFPVQTTVSSYINLSADQMSVVFGTPVTLTAQVASDARKYTATGSVTFTEGAVTLGSATLDSTGTATLALKSLGAGYHNISAAYAGDKILQASTGGPVAVGIQDYTLQAAPASVTIPAGMTGTTSINILPLGGSTQTVSLACSTLPADVGCTFSPASVTLDGVNPGSIKVTITTTLASAQNLTHGSVIGAVSTIAFAGLLLPLVRRKHLKVYFALVIMTLMTIGIAGCGSSSNPNIAKAGSYVITVNATGGAGPSAHSAPLVVTITK